MTFSKAFAFRGEERNACFLGSGTGKENQTVGALGGRNLKGGRVDRGQTFVEGGCLPKWGGGGGLKG